ncbi:hypothetical protein ACFO0M_23420 [Micromonospora mangrovi]|uniref:WD40 repeat domain-containing protein n=2 Tax=Micromonospora TaxID=1873 RepID=A0AAU7M4W4_9ACTN
MNHDRLRSDLAGLADEVTPVDLRDRALRTSRRLGVQRTVATTAAALVLVAAATGTALAVRPNGSPPPAPAGPTVSESPSPSGKVTPAPKPSRAPSPAPESPSAGAGESAPAVLDGTRYYLEFTGSEARIHLVRPGRHEVNMLPLGNDTCMANSMTISPDGKRLAWVKDGSTTGWSGALVTSRIDGTRQRTVATGISCLGSRALVWKGGDLLMAQKGKVSVLVDMAAGKPVNGDPGQETDRCWSPDGKWLASLDAESGQHQVTDEGVLRQYTYTPPAAEAEGRDGWAARSVSIDGRYVAVGWKGTDPSRADSSFAVIDTATGKVVDLPGTGKVRSILFTLDGKAIVQRDDTLTVLDGNFRQLDTVAEPASVRGQRLLAYVP